MIKYIAKRLLFMIPIVLGVAFLVFFIMDLTPGTPAEVMLTQGATQEEIDQLNHKLGYDRPFIQRYFSYLGNVFLHFDFGTSYHTGQSISKELVKALPISAQVAFNAIAFAACLGIPLGLLSAVKQYSLLDTIPTIIALFLAAVPSFWLGMLLLYAFALKLDWFPSYGADSFRNFILPMISLGLPEAAGLLRYTRSSMLETIRQDYIRTVRSKGASERLVIWKHALKNALIPIITIAGVNFAALLGGACATEVLYSLPGLGSMIVTGIRQKDIPAVMGATLLLSILCSLIILIVDIIYAFIDPRIKAKYTKRKS